MPDFHELPDDLLNVRYKTLGIVEDNTDDLACVYDLYYDLVKDFAIPREAYRRLVRLMNTVIRDKEKLEREKNPHILHGPQVENMMKRQASFEAHSYDVCVNGYKLYNMEDEQTSCAYCNSQRFQVSNPIKPLATMKMMSLGDIVSRLLSNTASRAELKYRLNTITEKNQSQISLPIFFDGEEYKAFKNNDNFQTMHITWKKKPSSFASYLSLILAEMHYLSTYGIVVKTPNNQIISLGCQIRYTRGFHPDNRSQEKYFPDSNAPLRTRQDYLDADPDPGFSGRNILTQLDVFAGPQSLVFDELHNTLGRGVSSELYQMLTVSLAPSSTKFFYYGAGDGFEVEQYPFYIPRQRLIEIGKKIDETSRFFIPVTFDGPFLNIIENTRGNRPMDYLNSALYIVPTLMVHDLKEAGARKAVVALTRGMCLSLQWRFTPESLTELQSCISIFHECCRQRRAEQKLSVSIFRPVMHYLSHIQWIIHRQGPLVAYSTRSQERSIGKFSDLITGKVETHKQAGNLIETVAIRNFIKRTFDESDHLQGIRPRPYSASIFPNI
ncbi:hypothetical protein [Parasitella parasitica]|uniref:Uncharacterized protein n=1 Tax=Parasitella parasitica TaxID=35722 RepID=A0A0B7NI59_9FUNG|nr:hypothetical protein [Parasitella parasitica]